MSVVDETATETATAYTTRTTDVEDMVYCDTVWACLLNDYLLDLREPDLDQNEEDRSVKVRRRKKKKKRVKRRKDSFPGDPSLAGHEYSEVKEKAGEEEVKEKAGEEEEKEKAGEEEVKEKAGEEEVKEKAGEEEPLHIINVDDIYDIRQTRSLDDSANNKSLVGINHIPEEADTLIEQIEALERKSMSRVSRHPEQGEGPVLGTRPSTSRFIKRAQPLGYVEDEPEPARHSITAGFTEIESAWHIEPVVTHLDIPSDDEPQHKSSPRQSLSEDNRRSSSRSEADSRRSRSPTGDPHVPVPISSPVPVPVPAPVDIKPTVTRRPIQDRTGDHAPKIYSDDKSTKSSKSKTSRSRSRGPPRPEEQREPEFPDPAVVFMGTHDHPIKVGASNASEDLKRAKTYDDREMSSRSSRDWGEAEFVAIEKKKKDQKKTLKVYNDDAILQRLHLTKQKEEHMKRRLERRAALSRIRAIKERLASS
jgi:hypothetical protein